MAEEQRMHEAGGRRLCANNCGFFGSPTTLNLCSNCMKEGQSRTAQLTMEKTRPQQQLRETEAVTEVSPVQLDTIVAAHQGQSNRCTTCRKRLGLTGFKCRCGVTSCGSHRYPEHHGCTFDYKSMGRVAIAMANPLVKAEKLHKI
ncbi:unnamed protein product [Withania somnifera]